MPLRQQNTPARQKARAEPRALDALERNDREIASSISKVADPLTLLAVNIGKLAEAQQATVHALVDMNRSHLEQVQLFMDMMRSERQ